MAARAKKPASAKTPGPSGKPRSGKQREAAPAPARNHRRLFVTMLSMLGPLLAVLAGFYIYLAGGRFVSTDNAYIKSEKIAVSADISGRVVEVSVRENQLLKKGAPLFRIDPEPFRIALERADARLLSARQEVESLRALHGQKLAELKLAQGDLAFYDRQFGRQKKLNRRGFASGTNLDEASRNQRNARDRIAAVMQDIARVSARLGGDPDIDAARHPSVREARAARDAAALDLRRTRVPAPVAGVVTNFDLQPGEYITAGKVVFSLVGAGDVWVDANFKETDLTHVRAGQSATIRVDAYPGRNREAVVASISPATGAEFALLPPQNSTGNWVKVVQRLPVRLRLKNPVSEPPLRAGMSVVVEIDTRHRRAMPGLARSALNWVRGLI